MKKHSILVILASFLLMLPGCTGIYGTLRPYPYQKAEYWYCEEMDMTIYFETDERGDPQAAGSSVVSIDGVTCRINIGFWENIEFIREGKTVIFRNNLLRISFESVGQTSI